MGPVTLTTAYLNDLGGSAEENSFALVANYSPMENLALEFAYVTQQDQASSTSAIHQAGNAWDVNASYKLGALTLATDVFGAEDIIELAYDVTAKFAVNDALSVKARYESVEYDAANGGGTSTNTTAAVYYALESNLIAVLETSKGDSENGLDAVIKTGIQDDRTTTAAFVAIF